LYELDFYIRIAYFLNSGQADLLGGEKNAWRYRYMLLAVADLPMLIMAGLIIAGLIID
jgi:hypothetical protein